MRACCARRSKISDVAVAGRTVISPVRRADLPVAISAAQIRNSSAAQVARDDRIEKPQLLRLRGIDRPGGEDQLERALGADQPRQALRAASARDDAQRHLRHPEGG